MHQKLPPLAVSISPPITVRRHIHEGKAETLIALPMIITGIQEKGSEFVSISTLF